MQPKVVKLELTKLIVIIATIVVVSFAAGFVIQTKYFQGMIGRETVKELNESEVTLQREVGIFKGIINKAKIDEDEFQNAIVKLTDELMKFPGMTPECVMEIGSNMRKLHGLGRRDIIKKSIDQLEITMKDRSTISAISEFETKLAIEAAKY